LAAEGDAFDRAYSLWTLYRLNKTLTEFQFDKVGLILFKDVKSGYFWSMFTGIIESQGSVKRIESEGTNKHFLFESDISSQLKVDQSVSHNGVCLTVTKLDGNSHWVTAIQETLMKSNIGNLKIGDAVNLERCMLNNGRFDGHIVQGHVDQTGIVTSIQELDGSWLFSLEYDPSMGNVTVEKGSISISGVSLTCFNSHEKGFSIAIIPYTFEHTNFHSLKKGDTVNLEFDIIGKYVKRLLGGTN
jgi:riboflavin synthase